MNPNSDFDPLDPQSLNGYSYAGNNPTSPGQGKAPLGDRALLLDTNPGFQPFGFAGGIHDRDLGLDWNLFAYAGNDLVNNLDVVESQAKPRLGWFWNCFNCFRLRKQLDNAIRECEAEFKKCGGDPFRELGFQEKYGGPGIDDTVRNCAREKLGKNGIYRDLTMSCAKCFIPYLYPPVSPGLQ